MDAKEYKYVLPLHITASSEDIERVVLLLKDNLYIDFDTTDGRLPNCLLGMKCDLQLLKRLDE